MKKLMALLLALVFALGMATVAFADEEETGETTATYQAKTFDPASESPITFTLNKVYTVSGAADNTSPYPAETLQFTVTADGSNPSSPSALPTVADLIVTGITDQSITITLPTYSSVGKWIYTIKEVAGSTQGVTYTTASIGMEVLITNGENGLIGQVGIVGVKGIDEDGNAIVQKNDTFVNEYDLGSLKVSKQISGDLASSETAFEIAITFTSEKKVLSSFNVAKAVQDNGSLGITAIEPEDWAEVKDDNDNVTGYQASVTIALKAAEDVTIQNIPAGVNYIVEEAAKYKAEDSTGADPEKGYTVSYDSSRSGTVEKADTKSTVVTNTKQSITDTGIFLDSAPYVILLAVAATGMFVMMGKKRTRED